MTANETVPPLGVLACVVDTLSRDCGSGIKWCSLFNYSNESFSLFVIYSGILKTRPMFQTCLLEFWGVGVFLKNERSFQLVYASIPFSHLKKMFFGLLSMNIKIRPVFNCIYMYELKRWFNRVLQVFPWKQIL